MIKTSTHESAVRMEVGTGEANASGQGSPKNRTGMSSQAAQWLLLLLLRRGPTEGAAAVGPLFLRMYVQNSARNTEATVGICDLPFPAGLFVLGS